MWPKFCMVLVARHELLSYQNLAPLSFYSYFGYIRHYTPVALLLCCDNIKDWTISEHLARQIKSKGNEKLFYIVGIRYIPSTI